MYMLNIVRLFTRITGVSAEADEQGGEKAVHSLKVGGSPEISLGIDERRGNVFRRY